MNQSKMKKFNVLLLTVALAVAGSLNANAFDWGSLLSGALNSANNNNTTDSATNSSASSGGSILSGILGGVLQNDNLEVKDLAGTWTVSGPSIQFKSDDILKQAGGAAAASVVKEKLMPYYSKLGLDGMTMKITAEGEITVTLKSGKSFSGTIKKGEKEGEMVLGFNKLSSTSKIGNITVQVSESISALSLMADVSKLQSLLTLVSDKLNVEQLSAITSLLEGYDGIYAGLEFTK